MISDFGYIFLFIIGSLAFIGFGLWLTGLIRPNRPNVEKLTTYECGEDTIGNAWGQFNVRFYVIALIFALFEVELVFLFPWAVVFGNEELSAQTHGLWTIIGITEAFIFIGILSLGLIYPWKKGYLTWIKPTVNLSKQTAKVPKQLYDRINQQYQHARPA